MGGRSSSSSSCTTTSSSSASLVIVHVARGLPPALPLPPAPLLPSYAAAKFHGGVYRWSKREQQTGIMASAAPPGLPSPCHTACSAAQHPRVAQSQSMARPLHTVLRRSDASVAPPPALLHCCTWAQGAARTQLTPWLQRLLERLRQRLLQLLREHRSHAAQHLALRCRALLQVANNTVLQLAQHLCLQWKGRAARRLGKGAQRWLFDGWFRLFSTLNGCKQQAAANGPRDGPNWRNARLLFLEGPPVLRQHRQPLHIRGAAALAAGAG